MLPVALVVQCFVKTDTLQGLCESLLKCAGVADVDLLFWCDSPVRSRAEERYRGLRQEVDAYLDRFIGQYGAQFRSVERKENSVNHGTCKTCQVAMDYAFESHPFAIFVEDDVIFSRDALLWFDAIRRQGLLDETRHWAIAGESVFFNARDKPLPFEWPEKMREMARRDGLARYYVLHNFLPSTCFATSAEKWREFGETRGQPLGDVDICKRCAAEDRHAIFPVVPRVKDVGMLHDNGYSVLIHSKAGVSEIKNTYVMAEDLLDAEHPAPDEFALLSKGAGEIYTQSTLLTALK